MTGGGRYSNVRRALREVRRDTALFERGGGRRVGWGFTRLRDRYPPHRARCYGMTDRPASDNGLFACSPASEIILILSISLSLSFLPSIRSSCWPKRKFVFLYVCLTLFLSSFFGPTIQSLHYLTSFGNRTAVQIRRLFTRR